MTKKMLLIGMALSLCACHSAHSANNVSSQAAKLDIVGVHLGMTPAQAKSALDQHRKGMQWSENKSNLDLIQVAGTYLRYLSDATAGWDSETVSVFFSTPPGDSKVIAVARTVNFSGSEEPTVESLRSSLTAKFGQPTYQFEKVSQLDAMDWGWNKAGQLSKPIGQPTICTAFQSRWENTFDGDEMPQVMQAMYSLVSLQNQQANDSGCAIGVGARIMIDSNSVANGKLSNGLRMVLIDPHDALQVAIATDNYVQQIKKAQEADALKKAGANKPPL